MRGRHQNVASLRVQIDSGRNFWRFEQIKNPPPRDVRQNEIMVHLCPFALCRHHDAQDG